MRALLALVGVSLLTGSPLCGQQILTCNSTSVPPVIRGEGITERIGDIVLNCTGGVPNAQITGHLAIFLTANVTNRSTGNSLSGIDLTFDNASGPQSLSTPGTLAGAANIVYNGLTFQLSSSGTGVLRIAGIRAAANQLMLSPNASIQAYLTFNSANLVSLTNSRLPVGTVARSLYGGFSSKLVCAPAGSPLPATLSFSNLLMSGAAFASTRVTEGFADAFAPRGAWANLNADSGVRIIVRYSGFPAGAQLLVPDVVAGSDAVQPTGGGDFGVAPAGGQYAASASGSLLLARVRNPDANGAGGSLAYVPGAMGSAPLSFDTVSAVPLANGSGFAVYEVVDANPNVLESAQFPAFLGLAPAAVNTPTITNSDLTLAPLSNVPTATAGDPIPRFQPFAAPSDCNIVGDCGANYFPALWVNTSPINLTGQAGTGNQVAYVQVQNQGGGVLRWNASAAYARGSGWLLLSPDSGINNGTVRVDAIPGALTPGVYAATITVAGGSIAGAKTVTVTFTVTAAPPPATPPPAILSVVNAASFRAGPLAPGSLATIEGVQFSGKNLAVTFDGLSAQVLYSSDKQLNVVVPVGLGSSPSAKVVVTVDGNASSPLTVMLASIAPAIFSGAVLNQDNSVNSGSNPAPLGSVLQIYATGLPGSGAISAQIGDRTVDAPYYAGPAPGLIGVEQVDLIVPQDVPAGASSVKVCGMSATEKVCSAAAPITLLR